MSWQHSFCVKSGVTAEDAEGIVASQFPEAACQRGSQLHLQVEAAKAAALGLLGALKAAPDVQTLVHMSGHTEIAGIPMDGIAVTVSNIREV